ncbi:hypothetical protein AVEN_99329-1 [Araneus ventricosus]|uniref:Uncharacterized protein n=1 Tax=Araneus ventricosus TaxID=182803 RepID=A0A4Y2V2Z9_ARAVE|nr:hypothetical protein AVEN_99329-1 [Araneus ventricosus]
MNFLEDSFCHRNGQEVRGSMAWLPVKYLQDSLSCYKISHGNNFTASQQYRRLVDDETLKMCHLHEYGDSSVKSGFESDHTPSDENGFSSK